MACQGRDPLQRLVGGHLLYSKELLHFGHDVTDKTRSLAAFGCHLAFYVFDAAIPCRQHVDMFAAVLSQAVWNVEL